MSGRLVSRACIATLVVLVFGGGTSGPKRTMPTFYFGLWNGHRIRPDEHGVCARSVEDAFETAVGAARELLLHSGHVGEDRSGWAYHVYDEGGLRLFTLPFSIAAVDRHYAHMPVRRRRAT